MRRTAIVAAIVAALGTFTLVRLAGALDQLRAIDAPNGAEQPAFDAPIAAALAGDDEPRADEAGFDYEATTAANGGDGEIMQRLNADPAFQRAAQELLLDADPEVQEDARQLLRDLGALHER